MFRSVAFVLLLWASCVSWADQVEASFPSNFLSCEGEVPTSLEGTWGIYATLTAQERASADFTSLASNELASIVMQFDGDEFSVFVPMVGSVHRAVANVSIHPFEATYELTDAAFNYESMALALVPCGFIEMPDAVCESALCRGMQEEIFQQLSDLTGSSVAELRAQSKLRTPTRANYYRRLATPSDLSRWSARSAVAEAELNFRKGEIFLYGSGGFSCPDSLVTQVNGEEVELPARALHCGCLQPEPLEHMRMKAFAARYNHEIVALLEQQAPE